MLLKVFVKRKDIVDIKSDQCKSALIDKINIIFKLKEKLIKDIDKFDETSLKTSGLTKTDCCIQQHSVIPSNLLRLDKVQYINFINVLRIFLIIAGITTNFLFSKLSQSG